MNEKKTDESLSKVLGAWKVKEPLAPRFQERVWNRIEQAETFGAPSFVEQISLWMGQLFARPAVAAAYVGVLLFSGLLAGHLKANAEQGRLQAELSARYMQSVNPYSAVQR